MSKVPEMGIFGSYEITNRKEDDVELEITTFSSIASNDLKKLTKAGWVQRAPNIVAYLKPIYGGKKKKTVNFSLDLKTDGDQSEPPHDDQ